MESEGAEENKERQRGERKVSGQEYFTGFLTYKPQFSRLGHLEWLCLLHKYIHRHA